MEMSNKLEKLVCSKCNDSIKKIVRIYKRNEYRDEQGHHEEQTLKAVFNTNGFTEMTFQYPTGYPELSTESHFENKVKREGWMLINEEFVK